MKVLEEAVQHDTSLGTLLCTTGNYHAAFRQLKECSADVLTSQQLAQIQLELGLDHPLWKRRTYTAEQTLYASPNQVYILRIPLDDELAQRLSSVIEHPQRRCFADEQTYASLLEQSLNEDPEIAHAAQLCGPTRVPVQDFDNNAVTRFLFGYCAAAYGLELEKMGINHFPLVQAIRVTRPEFRPVSILEINPQVYEGKAPSALHYNVFGLIEK